MSQPELPSVLITVYHGCVNEVRVSQPMRVVILDGDIDEGDDTTVTYEGEKWHLMQTHSEVDTTLNLDAEIKQTHTQPEHTNVG